MRFKICICTWHWFYLKNQLDKDLLKNWRKAEWKDINVVRLAVQLSFFFALHILKHFSTAKEKLYISDKMRDCKSAKLHQISRMFAQCKLLFFLHAMKVERTSDWRDILLPCKSLTINFFRSILFDIFHFFLLIHSSDKENSSSSIWLRPFLWLYTFCVAWACLVFIMG